MLSLAAALYGRDGGRALALPRTCRSRPASLWVFWSHVVGVLGASVR